MSGGCSIKCAWLRTPIAAAVLATLIGVAKADDGVSYSESAKSRIISLLNGRAFTPEAGCEDLTTCTELLSKLRAADFDVVEPAERSDRPDLPSYLRARKRCPGLDPTRITTAHRTYAATRDFAAYRVNLHSPGNRGEEILIFRAEHYVSVENDHTAATPSSAEATLLPGTFLSMIIRGCRLLSTAPAEDGDWFAKHNVIREGDYASELVEIGGRYFVLNLAPIAGPQQPKASWWYELELWDLGLPVDPERQHHKHVFYSFGYKPDAASMGGAREAPPG